MSKHGKYKSEIQKIESKYDNSSKQLVYFLIFSNIPTISRDNKIYRSSVFICIGYLAKENKPRNALWNSAKPIVILIRVVTEQY